MADQTPDEQWEEMVIRYTDWAMKAAELSVLLQAERARRVQALLQRPCVARPDGRE